jgi:hypothetical protein
MASPPPTHVSLSRGITSLHSLIRVESNLDPVPGTSLSHSTFNPPIYNPSSLLYLLQESPIHNANPESILKTARRSYWFNASRREC